MPSVALVPIRGITLADTAIQKDLSLNWNVLSPQQLRIWVEGYDPTGSLPGNFDMIETRLAPDAYLLMRCEVPDSPGYLQAYDNAETVLAALCIAMLLASDLWPDLWQQQPAPLYRARFKEVCDLPLVFDETQVRLVGHSSWFSWLSPSHDMLPPISKLHLLAATKNAPEIVDRMLADASLSNEVDLLLASSLRAMHSALQATTPGQLTANLVSAVELLVSAQDRELWAVRKARLKIIVGCETWTRCEELLAARHAFVHEANQPAASFMGHCALAMFVQAWGVFDQLLAQFGGQQSALDYLDQLAKTSQPRNDRTSDLSQERLTQLRTSYSGVPLGPIKRVKWIHQYLVDAHPNDYHKRFVVDGRISCPAWRCGHMLGPEQVTARDGGMLVYSCNMCGASSQAAIVSPEISRVEN